MDLMQLIHNQNSFYYMLSRKCPHEAQNKYRKTQTAIFNNQYSSRSLRRIFVAPQIEVMIIRLQSGEAL